MEYVSYFINNVIYTTEKIRYGEVDLRRKWTYVFSFRIQPRGSEVVHGGLGEPASVHDKRMAV
jgi:hypothetical protein